MALIPADAGLRLRLDNELQTQQVAPVKEISADQPKLQTGQTFTAQIRDVLPQNTYLALVAGKQVTLSLPENAKSGDVLELVVVDQTAKSIIAKLADQTGGTGQVAPQTTLSRTAMLLRSVLVGDGESPQAAPLNRGQPLLSGPPTNAGQLATVLNRAVTQSGLFYESHQAQWVAGKLPLASLRLEPQGQQSVPQPLLPGAGAAAAQTAARHPGTPDASPPSSGAASAATAHNAVARGLLLYQSNQAQEAGSTGEARSAGQSQAMSAAAMADSGPAGTPGAGSGGRIPEELRALVQQQLDAAGSQRLLWHGEIWPEQTMHWQLEWQEQGGQQGGGAEEETPWQTSLRLTTPRLGSLEASLQLGAAGVRIALGAADAASAQEMRMAAPELMSALEAAGLRLLGFSVRQAAEDAEKDAE